MVAGMRTLDEVLLAPNAKLHEVTRIDTFYSRVNGWMHSALIRNHKPLIGSSQASYTEWITHTSTHQMLLASGWLPRIWSNGEVWTLF